MKVAIISFHNAYNYGACLQAYALQEAILGLGIDCQYINYINRRRSSGYKMSVRIVNCLKNGDLKGTIRNVCGIPFVYLRIKKFNRFYVENLKQTDCIYHSSKEASKLNNVYDKFIVGSDQVWDFEHNGYDDAYLLSFVTDSRKKISYASSFGSQKINYQNKKVLQKYISDIECLSTREQYGVNLIRKLTGRNGHLVLDPVFLPGRLFWKRFINKSNACQEIYTFYYINIYFDPDDICRITGWKDNKKHILSSSVHIKNFITKNEKVTFSLSPEEFLNEIFYAQMVITSSFHGLAFSIIFHKPFIVVLSGEEGKDERLLNLLKIIGLEDRIFSRKMTLKDINREINYSEVDEKLLPFVNYSLDFLINSLYKGRENVDRLTEPQIQDEKEDYKICNLEKCTGCGTCAEKCPMKAITMLPDEDGFLIPVIEKTKCIQCSICKEGCQINLPQLTLDSQHYYVYKNDIAVRMKSSSGGAFRAMAEYVVSEGGVVVASEMQRDWTLQHTLARTMGQVRRQSATYYVQGKAFECFKEIEKLLKNGVFILFVGTPCQVAGLRCYLEKEYENLYLCDILCRGVPSPKLFKIFIDYLQSRGTLTQLKMRDKNIGWSGYCVSARINGKVYKNRGWLKAYSVMFSKGLINRTSCFQCLYSNYERQGDITIGDYWGIKKYHRELNDHRGVSLIISNNIKGENFIKRAINKNQLIEIKKEESGQNSLIAPMKKPARRTACILSMELLYETAAKKYGEWNVRGSVKEIIKKMFIDY